MCSGSNEGSYLKLIDFVYHSFLGLRVIKKKRRMNLEVWAECFEVRGVAVRLHAIRLHLVPRRARS